MTKLLILRKIIAELDLKKLPPKLKLELIKAMGFTGMRELHHPDCPCVTSSGYVCNCVPDPTYYTAPEDVVRHNGETWEERVAAKRARKA